MAAGLMISFGPEKGGKGDKPKPGVSPMASDDDEPGDSPEQASLDAAKAAIEKGDAKLWIKAVEMAMRCCKDGSGDDEEAPASEEY